MNAYIPQSSPIGRPLIESWQYPIIFGDVPNLEKVKAPGKCLWEAGDLANGFASSNYHGRRHR